MPQKIKRFLATVTSARAIMLVGATGTAASLLFPPFVYDWGQRVQNFGYGFLLNPPAVGGGYASVDVPMVLLEWAAIVLVCAFACFASKQTRQAVRSSSVTQSPDTDKALAVGKGSALSSSTRRVPTLVSTMIIGGLFIFSMWYLAQERGAQIGIPMNGPPIVGDSFAPVLTTITSQSSDGLPELDLETIEFFAAWQEAVAQERAQALLMVQGIDTTDLPEPSTESTMVEIQGRRLGFIRARWAANEGGAIRMVTVVGIEDGQLVRVQCIRRSDQAIPVWSGACGDGVRAAFELEFVSDDLDANDGSSARSESRVVITDFNFRPLTEQEGEVE